MRISTITDFLTLADKLDYDLAARKLFISVDELCQSISELEEELGISLFINNNRNEIELTRFGAIFARGAHKIERDYEDTISLINKAKGKPMRTMTIGTRYNAAQDESPYISRALRKYAPNITPVYTPLMHLTLREKLESGEIDAAVGIVVEDRLYDGFKTICIDRDVYEIVCPLDHPFAKMESVTLEQFAKESVIVPSPKNMASMHMFFTDIFEKAGIEIAQEAYCDDVDGLILQIEAGAGVSMVLSQRRSHFDDRVAFVPVADSLPYARINLIWSEETEKRIPGDWLKAFEALSID